jgi:hypothetical protein
MKKTTVTALLFTVIGMSLTACFSQPSDGSHSPGYKGTSSDSYDRPYPPPYNPVYPPPY